MKGSYYVLQLADLQSPRHHLPLFARPMCRPMRELSLETEPARASPITASLRPLHRAFIEAILQSRKPLLIVQEPSMA